MRKVNIPALPGGHTQTDPNPQAGKQPLDLTDGPWLICLPTKQKSPGRSRGFCR
jgi:hypothetical protein